MVIFKYDKSFEGLLTCVFDAYFRRSFPDKLMYVDDVLPLFYDEAYTVITDDEKSKRVWKSLENKISQSALTCITSCWLADTYQNIDELIFRYIHKAVDAPMSIEVDFGDADVLAMSKVYKQVCYERLRVMQFVRFQKAYDGTYFAAFEPLYNVLALVVPHFRDRFADQKWLIYDVKRDFGYYYDLSDVREFTFNEENGTFKSYVLSDKLIDDDEKLFQSLWKTYFKAIAIKERLNPRKHRQDMPVRYWKYLTEKQ